MRIIGGVHRGRRLRVPRGQAVRPTSDRVKEALFNILGPQVVGAQVLDLFAGTGNLSLEALSRGAQSATCVERSAAALRVLRGNARVLDMADRVRVMPVAVQRALTLLAGEGGSFSLVFMDPPYRTGQLLPTLDGVIRHQLVVPGAVIVAEHASDEFRQLTPPLGLQVSTRREYGDTALTFLVPSTKRQENNVPNE